MGDQPSPKLTRLVEYNQPLGPSTTAFAAYHGDASHDAQCGDWGLKQVTLQG